MPERRWSRHPISVVALVAAWIWSTAAAGAQAHTGQDVRLVHVVLEMLQWGAGVLLLLTAAVALFVGARAIGQRLRADAGP